MLQVDFSMPTEADMVVNVLVVSNRELVCNIINNTIKEIYKKQSFVIKILFKKCFYTHKKTFK